MPISIGDLQGSISLEDTFTEALSVVGKAINDVETRVQSAQAPIAQFEQAFSSMGAQASSSITPLTMTGDAFAGLSNSASQLLPQMNQTSDAFGALGNTVSVGTKPVQESIGYFQNLQNALSGQEVALRSFGEGVMGMIEHPIQSAKSALLGIVESIGPVGIALTALGAIVAAVGFALFEVGKKVFEFVAASAKFGGEINDMGEKMALSSERTSRLAYAFDVAGGSIQQASSLITMMQRRMADSPDDFEKGIKSIGLSMGQLISLQPDDQLYAIAKAFQENTNQTNRASASMEVFGRAGRDAIPQLMKPLGDLAAETSRYGVVLSDEATAASEQFEMASARLGKQFEAMKVSLGQELVPAFTVLLGVINESIASMREWGNIPELAGALNIIGLALGHMTQSTKDQIEATRNATVVQHPYNAVLGEFDQHLKDITASGLKMGLTTDGMKEKSKALEDTIKKNQKAQEDYNEALEHYNHQYGRDFLQVTDDIGSSMYEGIAFDHARGVSVADLARIYKTTTLTVEDVVNAEKKFATATKELGDAAKETLKPLSTWVQIAPSMVSGTENISASFYVLESRFEDIQKLLPGLVMNIDEIFNHTEKVVQQTTTWKDSLDSLSGSLTQLATISGDSFGGIMKDIANVVVSWNAAVKAADAYNEATTTAGKAAAIAQGVVAVSAATGQGSTGSRVVGGAASGAAIGSVAGPYGAAVGAVAGALVGLYRGWQENNMVKKVNDLRDAFQEANFAGSFSAMNTAAHEAGLTLDRLLNAKTVDEYTAAQNELTQALQHHKDVISAAGAFGPSQTQMQQMSDMARDVYEYMLHSGTYSAEQVQAAWEESARAAGRALGDASVIGSDAAKAAGFHTRAELEATAKKAKDTYEYMRDSGLYTAAEIKKAWDATIDAQGLAYDDATASIKDLVAQYDTLAQSVAGEAPEEVMGVIEAATRAQMQVLKDQGEAQLRLSGQNAEEAAANWEEALGRLHPQPVHIPIIWDVPSLPSGPEAPDAPTAEAEGTHGVAFAAGPQTFSTKGNEFFQFGGEGKGLSDFSNGSAPDNSELTNEIAGLRSDILYALPRAMRRVVVDAQQEHA